VSNGQALKDSLVRVHCFVDEAGDPVLFGWRGKVLVGTPGCSSFFVLGKLEVNAPERLGQELEALRAQLLADPYFRNVPSMQPAEKKTALAFHANNDLPEVRREVFHLLLAHDLRFQAVIRDKAALLAFVRQENERNPAYRYSKDEQYDLLVAKLFKSGFYKGDEFHITFAKRGRQNRTQALRVALEQARRAFERDSGTQARAKVEILEALPPGNPGLQAVDYFLWAVQRFYELGWNTEEGDRFLHLIWPKVAAIHDLDDLRNSPLGETYWPDRPLTVEALKSRHKKSRGI